MKKKKIILIGAIVVALIVIAGIIFLIAGKGKNSEQAVFEKYTGLKEIVSVDFLYGGEEATLVQKDGTWQWDEEPDLVLDQESASAQVETLKQSLAMEKLEEDDLKACGLEEPEISITIKDKSGRKMTFYIGTLFDVNNYYATIDGGDDIYMISGQAVEVIDSLSAQKIVSEQMDSMTSATVDDTVEEETEE